MTLEMKMRHSSKAWVELRFSALDLIDAMRLWLKINVDIIINPKSGGFYLHFSSIHILSHLLHVKHFLGYIKI